MTCSVHTVPASKWLHVLRAWYEHTICYMFLHQLQLVYNFSARFEESDIEKYLDDLPEVRQRN